MHMLVWRAEIIVRTNKPNRAPNFLFWTAQKAPEKNKMKAEIEINPISKALIISAPASSVENPGFFRNIIIQTLNLGNIMSG